MEKHDGKAFAELMTATAMYYDREMPDPLIRLYWNGLRDYELDVVRRAFTEHAKDPTEGKFMPKLAQLIERITGSMSDRTREAWVKVSNAIRHIGHTRSVCFDDPAIHAALRDLGGFKRLCDESSDTMPFRQREFAEAYASYATRTGYDYPAVFEGMGHQPELVYIGNRAEALGVEQGGRQNNAALPAELSEAMRRVLIPSGRALHG